MTKKLSRAHPQRFAAYRQFVERMPVGALVVHVPKPEDTDTWKIVAANWLAIRLLGSSVAAILEGPLAVNLPPDMSMPELVRHALRFGRVKNLGHVAERDSASGGSYWAKLFAVDEHCVAFCIEDQSLLRQARNSCAEAESRCALISESGRAILWRADPDTLQISFVSPEAQHILGYWPERWRQETNFWKNHVHPEDLERMMAHCCAARDEGVSAECEFRMFSTNNTVLWFRLLVRHAAGRNGLWELLGVMTEITKLKEAEQHTQDLSRRLIHLQDQEHRRISRELHDSVGQNLAALRMSLHTLEQQAAALDDKGRLALTDSVHLADSAIQETRTVSYLLHPPVLDELGLTKALDWFVDGFSKRSGISVRLHAPPAPFRLPAEMELALFRVVQECLTNVHRHSQSRNAEVRIQIESNTILLEISDSGGGISPKLQGELNHGAGKTGVGLSGIRERVAEMHGTLDIDSNRHGTTIRVLVPMPAQPEKPEHSQDVPNDVAGFTRSAARGQSP